jgi:hypothetical protein
MDGISSKEILFKFKTEGPAAALEYASYLARGAEFGGISQYDALTLAGISGTRASGGPVMGGGTYLVGERGPELFTPSSSGNITPNGAMGGAMPPPPMQPVPVMRQPPPANRAPQPVLYEQAVRVTLTVVFVHLDDSKGDAAGGKGRRGGGRRQ